MNHPTGLIDVVAVLAGVAAVVFLLRGWRRALRTDVKWALVILLAVTLFHSVSNSLEWLAISHALDSFEDFLETLEPILWCVFFYAFLQSLSAQSLRDSQILLDETQRLTGVGGWEYDVHTGHITWTDEVYHIHEFPVDPSVDHIRASLACYQPDDRVRVEQAFRAAVEHGTPYDLEVRFTTARQNERWVRTTARAIREDGKVVRVMGNILDVTERKRAEETLRNSLQTSADIMHAIPSGMFVYQYQAPDSLTLMDGNPAARRITGLDIDARRGVEFDVIWPQARKSGLTARMLAVMKTGETYDTEEFAYQDQTLAGVFRICAFRMPADRLGVVFEDVTARKRAEEERTKLETQLRQSQKMEAVGQLAGGIAHDFNNILTTILGNIELSMDALRASLPEEDRVLQELRQVGQAAERAATLTRRLLVFSRRDVAHPVVLDLNRTLSDTEKLLRRLISEDIQLEFVLASDLARVRIDVGQVEQIIMNLAVNARDAMPGGGQLVLETSNVELDAEYVATHADAQPGRHVLLRVSDTGSGMDAATLERIFEPFFTTKASGTGTGLGLATVHGIVSQVGGHVTAYSELGVGSTFNVYLPAVEAHADTTRGTVGLDFAPGGNETVLVCEDDETVRQLASQILQHAGYTVLAAASGEQALWIAERRTKPVQLLVTDVILPGMNGKALAEALAIRQPGLRTLYMSGYTANVIAHHGVLDEGLDFLQKPFTRQSLLRYVRDVLDRVRTEDRMGHADHDPPPV